MRLRPNKSKASLLEGMGHKEKEVVSQDNMRKKDRRTIFI
jgi:hypothetical protein